jgi:signal peptidase II
MALKPNVPKGKQILFVAAIVVLILDIVTKQLIRSAVTVGDAIEILPFFSIAHVQNQGVAFGLLQIEQLRWVLTAVALAVAAVIFMSCAHNKLKEHYLAWGLIAGGAVGNALDRITIGVVTDFLSFSFWPAFNVADSALTIGVVLLCWHAMRKE